MKFIKHDLGGSAAVEVVSDEVLINSEQDALDLMAEIGINTWNNNTDIQLIVKDIRPTMSVENKGEIPLTASNN